MVNALTSHNGSKVGLAELLTALKLLKPESNETLALIAESLGLNWRGIDALQPSGVEGQLPLIEDSLEKVDADVAPELNVSMPSPDPKFLTDLPAKILEPIGYEDQTFEILDDPILATTEALEPTNIDSHMRRPSYQPLLQDKWFRGLMSIMLSTLIASDKIDWKMLERKMIRGELLDRLPFRKRPTLQRGILLFLDRSESLQPFWRDEKELVEKLQRLIGRFKVEAWWFEVDHWLIDGPRIRWFSPPPLQLPRNASLLLVSDFGISGELSLGRIDLDPWNPLIDIARRNNCPMVSLIPAPISYWPNALKRRIPNSFVWDYDTSIATVMRNKHQIR